MEQRSECLGRYNICSYLLLRFVFHFHFECIKFHVLYLLTLKWVIMDLEEKEQCKQCFANAFQHLPVHNKKHSFFETWVQFCFCFREPRHHSWPLTFFLCVFVESGVCLNIYRLLQQPKCIRNYWVALPTHWYLTLTLHFICGIHGTLTVYIWTHTISVNLSSSHTFHKSLYI